MEELKEFKDLTPKQQKLIKETFSRSRKQMFFAAIKFGFGSFLLNFLSFNIGMLILKDVDPENQATFRFVATIINIIFMCRYLDGQLRTISANVTERVKEILTQTTTAEEEKKDEFKGLE